MQRTVNAPDQEWLTCEEAASWIGIPPPTLKTMEKQGQIPPGRKFSNKAKRWHWEVIVAVSVLVKCGFLPMKEVKEAGEEDDG